MVDESYEKTDLPTSKTFYEPSKEQIIKAVNDSGYLMEQEVALTLESLGFQFVQSNYAFKDSDTNESREVDVYATKYYFDCIHHGFLINVSLICECKNYSAPLVFFGRQKNLGDIFSTCEQFVFTERGKGFTNNIHTSFISWIIFNKFHYYQQNYKATQFALMTTKNGRGWRLGHEDLYDGIFFPLIKSLLYVRKAEIDNFSNFKKMTGLPDNLLKTISIYIPVVIVNGSMYYVDAQSNPIDPLKMSHITFIRGVKDKTINGVYLIDFVTKDHLIDFIQNKVEPLILSLKDMIDKNPAEFKKLLEK
jgi:hypothetical protein